MTYILDFQPRWRRRLVYFASSHNQKMDNNKFKNKKQPELTENHTVWKSNNQGVKEETFDQTGRRGQRWATKWRGHTARRWLVDQRVPCFHVDKPGRTNEEQDRPHNSGF